MKQAPEWLPPWAERAVGAAAAAVFLAGVVSTGLVDSEDPTAAPDLAAPAAAGTTTSRTATTELVDSVSLPPVIGPSRGERAANRHGGTVSGLASAPELDRAGTTPATTPAGTPAATDTGSGSPDPVEAQSSPTPSVGVAVGPVAVGASTAGAGASVAGTPVGDQSSVPDPSSGVTVTIDTGVGAPIQVTLP